MALLWHTCALQEPSSLVGCSAGRFTAATREKESRQTMHALDLISIEKKTGEIIASIRASVMVERIIILDSQNPGVSIPLEPGDHITRATPHGLIDIYEVIAPNYLSMHERDGSSGYRAQVKYVMARRAPYWAASTPWRGEHPHKGGGAGAGGQTTSIQIRGDHASVRVHAHDHMEQRELERGAAALSWRGASVYRVEQDARELHTTLERLGVHLGEPLSSLQELNRRVLDLNARGYSPEEISHELMQHPSQSTHDARQSITKIVREQGTSMLNNLGSNAVFALLLYAFGLSGG